MKIIDWAITQCQYNVYLNALGSDYSFFIPTNNALVEYIDPCSYGKNSLQLLSFRYDESKRVEERVSAVVYNYDPETGARDSVGMVTMTTNPGRIERCLRDILDTHIVIGKVWEGKNTYFRTKNGTGIRVYNADKENDMYVEGSYQMYDTKNRLKITRVYDQRKKEDGGPGGNGKSYVLEGQPIMGTRRTVRDQLADYPEFAEFLELMDGSGLFETIHNLGTGKESDNKACGGTNVSLFNTYHYTIYVPSNYAIKQLQNDGKLPTWEQVEAAHEAGNEMKAINDSVAIVNFLKYHIQDNALYIGAQNESGDFETSLINSKTKRFYVVKANLTDDAIEVTDATGATHKVVKQTGQAGRELYNIQAREYLYDSNDAKTATNLYTTSSAVIHLIDGPLAYGN